MPTFGIPQLDGPAPSPDAVRAGFAAPAPGKSTLAASDLRESVEAIEPGLFSGHACDPQNVSSSHVRASDCVLAVDERERLDSRRREAIGRMQSRWTDALNKVRIDDVFAAMKEGPPVGSVIGELILAAFTFGVSTGLVRALGALRAMAQVSTTTKVAGFLAHQLPVTDVGPIARIAAKLPDAAITSPVSSMVGLAKARMRPLITTHQTTHDAVEDFLGQLAEESDVIFEDLVHLPSKTASDVELATQLMMADDLTSTGSREFSRLITSQAERWTELRLGDLGTSHTTQWSTIGSRATRFEYTEERKLVELVKYGRMGSRYAISCRHSRSNAVTADDGGHLEGIVPDDLLPAALVQHLAMFGTPPEKIPDWGAWRGGDL
ncbi:MAG TPA: hypothetical protein VGM88_03145 [Kofleriaceae bacterium]|jgi:hypothetical protein